MEAMASPEFQPSPSHWYQESPENPETKDQMDLLDPLDPLDKTARRDHPDQKERPDRTVLPAKTDRPDPQDPPEAVEAKARRVSARSTAPWTAESSSRTALGVKRQVEVEVGRDSQVSQRNAVFLLLFCVPLLFAPSGGVSKVL